jgi:hypothetical protein
MKTIFKYIGLCLFSIQLFSQNHLPNNDINGTYHLLEAERGVGTKIFEYGQHNDTKLLLIAACKQCMPGTYTYKKDASEELDRAVFFNTTGLYIFQYDNESFVMIMINPKAENWTDFYYSNFYSKSKSKVQNMSKEKIKEFIIKISS